MKKIGINSNIFRIIAIFAVILDHIGVFFASEITENTYYVFRLIGRIAMPMFAFLLVQGFFHTKDIIKYIKRLFVAGAITQILVFILYTVNIQYFPEYIVTKDILNVNIILSFAVILIILKFLDMILNMCKQKEVQKKEIIIYTMAIVCLLVLYFVVEFDYSYYLVIYSILIYFTEKIKDKITKKQYYLIYVIIMVLFLSMYSNKLEWFAILSLPFIMLYNGKRNNKNKILNICFYAFYPIQYLIIYLIAMIR